MNNSGTSEEERPSGLSSSRKILHKRRMTEHDYEVLLESQNGVCPICLEQPPLVIDHCHETTYVRGLAHRNCNSGIGLLGESPENLRRAADYIEAFQKRFESGDGAIYQSYDPEALKQVFSGSKHLAPTIGSKFGELEILSDPIRNDEVTRVSRWWVKVRCTCGVEKEVRLHSLLHQGLTTCGASHHFQTHGDSGTPLYRKWLWAKRTGDNWHDTYEDFKVWAARSGWQEGLELSKMDFDLPLSPQNSVWRTKSETIRSAKRSGHSSELHLLTYKDETKSMAAWADDGRCKVPYSVLNRRIILGWPTERALTEPVDPNKSRTSRSVKDIVLSSLVELGAQGMADLLQTVEAEFESKSADPRRAVRSAINNMTARGEIIRDESGRLSLP